MRPSPMRLLPKGSRAATEIARPRAKAKKKKQNRTKLKQIAKNTTFKRKENTETTKTEANLGRNLRVNGDRSTAPTLAHTHTHTTHSPAKKIKKTF